MNIKEIEQEGRKRLNALLEKLENIAKEANELERFVCKNVEKLTGGCWEVFGDCDVCPVKEIMMATATIREWIEKEIIARDK